MWERINNQFWLSRQPFLPSFFSLLLGLGIFRRTIQIEIEPINSCHNWLFYGKNDRLFLEMKWISLFPSSSSSVLLSSSVLFPLCSLKFKIENRGKSRTFHKDFQVWEFSSTSILDFHLWFFICNSSFFFLHLWVVVLLSDVDNDQSRRLSWLLFSFLLRLIR